MQSSFYFALLSNCLHVGCLCAEAGKVKELGQLVFLQTTTQLWPGGPNTRLYCGLMFNKL